MSEKIESVFVVIGQDGKIWEETVSLDQHEATAKFVRSWLSVFKLERHDIWSVWQMAMRSGFKTKELFLEPRP